MAATYQIGALPLARTDAEARREELKRLMSEIAATLLPFARSASEKQKCFDVRRGRYDWAVLNALLDIQARSDTPDLLADMLAAESGRRAPAINVSAYDVSLEEERTNGPLNEAQQLAQREKSPTRWAQVRDLANRQLRWTRTLLVAAHREATPTAKRTA